MGNDAPGPKFPGVDSEEDVCSSGPAIGYCTPLFKDRISCGLLMILRGLLGVERGPGAGCAGISHGIPVRRDSGVRAGPFMDHFNE